MASTTHRKESAMSANTNTTTTIMLNDEERFYLRTILDIARQDEAEDGDDIYREQVADFAERLYSIISNEWTYES